MDMVMNELINWGNITYLIGVIPFTCDSLEDMYIYIQLELRGEAVCSNDLID